MIKTLFLSRTRYKQPLDATTDKKFRTLAVLGQLFVLGFSQDLRPRFFEQHARFYLLPQLPFGILRYLEFALSGLWLALWLIFRRQVRIVVAQSPYEGFVGGLAKNLAGLLGCRVKLVVESHGDFEHSLFLERRVAFPAVWRAAMGVVAGFALHRADVLRAISQTTQKQLKDWASETPCVVFPTWTDIDVFLHGGETKDWTCAGEILYAGVINPLKGVDFLIAAFQLVAADFPESKLIIAGRPTNRRYMHQLVYRVETLGLNERIRFVGEIPQETLARHMVNSRVLVLPSLSEGFGRVLFEAMATGTPVIGSRIGGIKELIEDGQRGFLVEAKDVSALAGKLRYLLENVLEAERMGRAGRAFVRTTYSSETYLTGYREVFNLAAGSPDLGVSEVSEKSTGP